MECQKWLGFGIMRFGGVSLRKRRKRRESVINVDNESAEKVGFSSYLLALSSDMMCGAPNFSITCNERVPAFILDFAVEIGLPPKNWAKSEEIFSEC